MALTSQMRFYVLRVASNREEFVRDALKKKVKIEKLEDKVGRILVPVVREKQSRRKGKESKVVEIEKKSIPGYVFVEMQVKEDGSILDDVFFLIQDISGVGSFIGSADGKRPSPMEQHEVDKMLADEERNREAATIATDYRQGDQVKIKDGPFESFEGTVDSIDDQKGKVSVIVTIFGRATPLELEYWQIERL